MNQIYYFLTVTLLCFGPLSSAQLFPYNFTVSTETYSDLENATLLSNDTWDDPEYAVPIGFDFEFFGSTSNTLYFVGLGGTIIFDNDLYSSPIDLFYVYGSDIIDRGYNDYQMLSPISYKLEGSPGSRVFKLEWKNAGFYEELSIGNNSNFVNLQLWLYEGSNNIEIHFGPNNITLDDLVHDINGDPFIAFAEDLDLNNYTSAGFWNLAGDPANPTINFIDMPDYYSFTGLDEDPVDGTVYRFEFDLTDVRENNALDQIVRVWPTLVQDQVFVTVSDDILRDGTIQVFSQSGQLVKREPLEFGTHAIDMGDLPNGPYFVHVQRGNSHYSEKILKQ